MSTRSRIIFAAALAALATAAVANGIGGGTTPQVGGGLGQFDGGISSIVSHGGPPPSSCDGTINLGACSQPMLGGVGGTSVVSCDGSINFSSGCTQPAIGGM